MRFYAIVKKIIAVVPHAGTWIEIEIDCYWKKNIIVVPHAGTWIEMNYLSEI